MINEFIISNNTECKDDLRIKIIFSKITFPTKITNGLIAKRKFPFSESASVAKRAKTLYMAIKNTLKTLDCKFQKNDKKEIIFTYKIKHKIKF